MTEKLDIFKCHICGNVIQVLINGVGELVCCGEKMELLPCQFQEDELGEKHVPEIIEKEGKKFIELNKHPMSEEHYIQFIQAFSQDKSEIRLKYLHPEEKAEFDITDFDANFAIELCNIHNLWRSKNEN